MSVQRNTLQRKIILDALRRQNNHPSIEELYADISKEYPTISKTTVYRNLRILAENGVVARVSLPDGLERYEPKANPHYHFHCKKCRGIFDVEMPYLSDLDQSVESLYGFQVADHDVIFEGFCGQC